MGISLSYTCSTSLSKADRARLLAAVEHATSSRSWWAESIRLWEQDDSVAGKTKIFLPGYATGDGDFREVDPEDDTIMAWRDSVQICTLLQEYARAYRLVWEIDLAGKPFGQIDGDNDEAFTSANGILQVTGFNPTDPSLPRRIAEIDAQHSDRWG